MTAAVLMVTIVIAIFLIISLLFGSNRHMKIFETICNQLFAMIVFLTFFRTIESTYKFVTVKPGYAAFWTAELQYALILPATMVWLLRYFAFKPHNWAWKAFSTIMWGALLTAIDQFNFMVPIFERNNWKVWYALIYELCVFLLCLLFFTHFRRILQKERARS